MKKWVVTAVDYGGDFDGKARVLGVFDTKEEGDAYIRNDIEEWVDDNPNEDAMCDFDKMRAYLAYEPSICCEWNNQEVEV